MSSLALYITFAVTISLVAASDIVDGCFVAASLLVCTHETNPFDIMYHIISWNKHRTWKWLWAKSMGRFLTCWPFPKCKLACNYSRWIAIEIVWNYNNRPNVGSHIKRFLVQLFERHQIQKWPIMERFSWGFRYVLKFGHAWRQTRKRQKYDDFSVVGMFVCAFLASWKWEILPICCSSTVNIQHLGGDYKWRFRHEISIPTLATHMSYPMTSSGNETDGRRRRLSLSFFVYTYIFFIDSLKTEIIKNVQIPLVENVTTLPIWHSIWWFPMFGVKALLHEFTPNNEFSRFVDVKKCSTSWQPINEIVSLSFSLCLLHYFRIRYYKIIHACTFQYCAASQFTQ